MSEPNTIILLKYFCVEASEGIVRLRPVANNPDGELVIRSRDPKLAQFEVGQAYPLDVRADRAKEDAGGAR
jgi:hypothetical protein